MVADVASLGDAVRKQGIDTPFDMGHCHFAKTTSLTLSSDIGTEVNVEQSDVRSSPNPVTLRRQFGGQMLSCASSLEAPFAQI